jgi:hypothetical protein
MKMATRRHNIHKMILDSLCLLVANLFPIAGFADEPAYVIATQFDTQGKVLELDVPSELDGTRFTIGVEDSDGQRSIHLAVTREGTHCYEVRDLAAWHGTVKYVAMTALKGVSGRVKVPSFADSIDMFLEPDRITPSTINILVQHRIFGFPWTVCLIPIFAAAAVFLRVRAKKKTPVALALGFLVAWTLMDLRLMFDHGENIYREEKFRKGMGPLTLEKRFGDRAADAISNQTWGDDKLEGYEKYFEYRLADRPYALTGAGRSPALWITDNPAEGPVLFQDEKYYLVKKDKP